MWAGLAAGEDRDPRAYYALAALYALPLARSGLEVDGFALALLVLGALHLQAERIAQTEPEAMAELLGAAAVRTRGGVLGAHAHTAGGHHRCSCASGRQLPSGPLPLHASRRGRHRVAGLHLAQVAGPRACRAALAG